jgi:hypothetical protein
LGLFELNFFLNLLFLPNKSLFHSKGKVGSVSMLSYEILLVSDDVWELSSHELGVGHVRSTTTAHGTEAVGFSRLLKCFLICYFLKANVLLYFVDHYSLFALLKFLFVFLGML